MATGQLDLLAWRTAAFLERFGLEPTLLEAADTLQEEVDELIKGCRLIEKQREMESSGQANFLDPIALHIEATEELIDVMVSGFALVYSVSTPLQRDRLAQFLSSALETTLKKNDDKSTLTHVVHHGKITRRSKIVYSEIKE